ncbi:MAG TPA: hypothetical protein VN581_13630 [Patescibacteria group bacterium]|nr:hypothetical protein [Patescibacteria group bacterium]
MQCSLRGLALVALTVVPPTWACDASRPLADALPDTGLLAATRALAAASGCRILLAADLAERPTGRAIEADLAVADALDVLAVALDLNWTLDDHGEIRVVTAAQASTHAAEALTIEAVNAPTSWPMPIDQARSPGERSPAVARTHLGEERFDDDALHDYATAVARAPGVYGMASSDVIRGISASRLSPSQRASLLTLDGIPLPAEAWLFNRPGLGLVRTLDITRVGTGLASAYGAGAGDLAMGTQAPDAATHLGVGLSHAPALAPQISAVTTGALGVPGLRTAFGASRQIGTETIDSAAEPDVFHQHQTVARVAWSSPNQAHLLQASALDFSRSDLGGGEIDCGGGLPHCLLGADVELTGAAASWQFEPGERWRWLVLAGSSDTRTAVTRYEFGQLRPAQPAYVRMHHAEARAEVAVAAHARVSIGVMQARRDYRVHGERSFVLVGTNATALGMVPAGPGPATLAYANAETARTDLPQIHGEWHFDDGERWEGHIGLRAISAESASRIDVRDVRAENCALAPGRHPGLSTCAEALHALVQARNERVRHRETLLLPNAALRWRDATGQWLSLQWRDAFLGSDVTTLALSPDSALERLRSSEIAWLRPFAATTALELRVYHHDWRDRVANFTARFDDAIRFDSEIFGGELQLQMQPHEHGEWWLQAGLLHTRSNLDPIGRDDAAVRGAPEWSLGFGGRHRFGNGVHVGGHYSHAASTWIVNDNASIERLDARDLLDLRIGFRRGRFDLSVWGTNLFDDDYVADAYGQSLLLTPYHAHDRIVGVDARFDY